MVVTPGAGGTGGDDGGGDDNDDGAGVPRATTTPKPVTNLATGFLSAAETVRDTAVSAVMLSLVVAWLGLRAIDEGEKRRGRGESTVRSVRSGPTREPRQPI